MRPSALKTDSHQRLPADRHSLVDLPDGQERRAGLADPPVGDPVLLEAEEGVYLTTRRGLR